MFLETRRLMTAATGKMKEDMARDGVTWGLNEIGN